MNSSDRSLDAFKKEYLSPTPDRELDQNMLELVAEYVISRLTGGHLLELGVGDQIWTPKLVKKFEKVTTIDGSKELLRAMRERLAVGNWFPVVSYFEEYQPEVLFDTVLMTYVLEHVDDPSLILRRARRHWIRECGSLAVVVPHALGACLNWGSNFPSNTRRPFFFWRNPCPHDTTEIQPYRNCRRGHGTGLAVI
jgi:2-polyprenyl-3-methyl-5-hydroxy-6-metoxy-1,4-benzoquinol methylase